MADLKVRVQPRAKRNEIAGERDGVVVVRVTAPPVEGAANEAVRALIAKALGVAKGRVEVVRGKRGREKLVRVADVGEDELRRLLLGD